MKYLIFVYGTLKQNFSRHSVLQNQRYLGIAQTIPKYLLYRIADFPGLVRSIDHGKKIWGELYEIDSDCLLELDEIEGVPYGLFQRLEVSLSEATISHLPTTNEVFSQLQRKSAEAYFFLKNTEGTQECGNCWLQ